jgi:hypothetical protein
VNVAVRGLLGGVVVALGGGGCADFFGPRDAEELVAGWEEDEVVLENRGARTVFYMAMSADTAPLVYWIPCVDLEMCPHLPPGETVRLGADRVLGLTEETAEVLVYWWVAERQGGERQAGPIQLIRILR